MKRISLLFAAFLVAATVAGVPLANAQQVHYIGVGSSAMFQGFGVAAVNDLANAIATGTAASPYNYCASGSGDTCSVKHWSEKGAPFASLIDSRASIPPEVGNIWVVWVDCTGAGCPAYTGGNGATEVWAYLSVDSTVGVRAFLGRDASGNPGSLLLDASANNSQVGVNAINQALFVSPWNGSEATQKLDSDVFTSLNGAFVTAGMTDIRPEDALYATYRLLGNCPAAGCGNPADGPFNANPCPTSDTGVPGVAPPNCATSTFTEPYFYSFSLGYGNFPGPGTQILESTVNGALGGTAKATPVGFALPGSADPFSGVTVPSTIGVFPVGEAPIILIANRKNANGLGQVIGSFPACGAPGTDTVVCTSGGAFTSDGSYYVRNMWDQHPFPPVAGTFPSTTAPSVGVCAGPNNVSGNPIFDFCHITRRPLGNMFAGNLCEGRNTSFSWPLDAALEGARTKVPNGIDFPVNLVLREPLSGTFNTFEFTEVRRFGGPSGNHTTQGGVWGKPPFISQEENAQISTATNTNPLQLKCTAGFNDTDAEGSRYRAIGTGDAVKAVQAAPAGNTDIIAYAFFSFGNVSSVGNSNSFGYLMIDGVDPLFADYQDTAGTIGQPAVLGSPLTWGRLPVCTPGGVPDCTASSIWNGGLSFPHLRDGTYPAWSELRMICNTAAVHCKTGAGGDPFGAQSLVDALQQDIHFDHLGGVPDLLPFDDAKNWTSSGYGDVAYIRDHFSYQIADDEQNFNNGPDPNYQSSMGPQTTHQSLTIPNPNCAGGVVGVNGPPTSECGGDVGGFVYVVGTTNKGGQLQ